MRRSFLCDDEVIAHINKNFIIQIVTENFNV